MTRMKISEIETPVLMVDLDGMEKNILEMSTALRGKPVKLRPHFKAHQVLAFASKQIQAGAVGIACARMNHAEALVQQGIKSVLIANEIVDDYDIRRLVELSSDSEVLAAVDNPIVVSKMSKIAGNRRKQLNLLVDLNIGLCRCGVSPGDDSLTLAKCVVAQGLTFRGLIAHRGSVRLSDAREKERVVGAALQTVVDCKRSIESAGIPVEIVSVGGTSDYLIAANCSGVTEIQPGSYLLMDSWYVPYAPDFRTCLTILATVISAHSGRIVLNAGSKTLSGQRGLPVVKHDGGLQVIALHAEHTIVELQDPSIRIEVGDRIELWVHYLDGTVSLHNRMYGIRKGEVEDVFPIIH
jgi:D-serine deaminase-like pyridoxal phosphate-dependent protein